MNTKLYYCRKCGTLEQMFECSDYDPENGKKIWRPACPNKNCERNCDFFGHDYKNRAKIFGIPYAYEAECKKCGYIPQYNY